MWIDLLLLHSQIQGTKNIASAAQRSILPISRATVSTPLSHTPKPPNSSPLRFDMIFPEEPIPAPARAQVSRFLSLYWRITSGRSPYHSSRSTSVPLGRVSECFPYSRSQLLVSVDKTHAVVTAGLSNTLYSSGPSVSAPASSPAI